MVFPSVPRSPYVYAISAVLLWSTVASAFKISLRYLSPLELLFYSSMTSALVLFILLILTGRLRDMRVERSDIPHYALSGFLNPFFYYLVLFKAYDMLPAQEAQPLNYTWQIVLSVMAALLLKQKVRARTWVGIAIAFIGVVIISSRGSMLSFSNPVGVGLALGSAFIWASFWIINMKDERDAVEKLFLCFLFGTMYIGLLFAFMGIWNGFRAPSLYGISGAIYVGLFEMGLTFVLWLKALESAENTASISLLIYLSPFISFVMIHFLVGEEILISTIVGTVLIVSGIVMENLGTLMGGKSRV